MEEFNNDVQVNGRITVDSVEVSDITAIAAKIYPVGSLYMSVSETPSPAQLFGGDWEQLTGDAYLKIIVADAGKYGGTSQQHKIPVNSMPKHRHAMSLLIDTGNTFGCAFQSSTTNASWQSGYIEDTGGGAPYYPYYYGIYAWIRTA